MEQGDFEDENAVPSIWEMVFVLLECYLVLLKKEESHETLRCTTKCQITLPVCESPPVYNKVRDRHRIWILPRYVIIIEAYPIRLLLVVTVPILNVVILGMIF